MPPRKNKRKLDVAPDEDASPCAPRTAMKKKKIYIPSSSESTSSGEFGADVRREDSRSFLDWSIFQKNFAAKEKDETKAYLSTFYGNIMGEHGKILASLQNETQDMTSERTKFVDGLVKAYEGTQNSKKSPTSQTEHPLYKAGKKIIAATRAIIDRHNEANQATLSNDFSLPEDTWKIEEAEIEELLLCGRLHGEKLAKSIVVPNSDSGGLKTNDGSHGEAAEAAVGFFSKVSLELDRSDTWGAAVKAQVTAIDSVVKTLTPSKPSIACGRRMHQSCFCLEVDLGQRSTRVLCVLIGGGKYRLLRGQHVTEEQIRLINSYECQRIPVPIIVTLNLMWS
ncbi:hypothetical protein NKR23_g11108 [Pleurostoma richardsiae]|uniref:Uncharacterized protein n=1 Tax=Pleurostoma richardsiae TaxID=41990 RepID=A0AA38R443_9PEZI|nr:hypothetical protein NKR23_g11108 [Pleurostoma richardsiae]